MILTIKKNSYFIGIVLQTFSKSRQDIPLDKVGVTLDRIAGRLTHGERFRGAIGEVERHYDQLENDFLRFFPDLVEFVHGENQQRPGTSEVHDNAS